MNLNGKWRRPGGYREVLAMALPLILSTSAWAVQEFVDRMFLAWYSAEAIAAALPAGMLQFSLFSLFLGIANYSSTFVAQYHGAGRPHRIGPAMWQGIYVALIGAVFLLLMIPLAEPIFNLVAHDPAVRSLEAVYFQTLCLGGGFILMSTAMAGFFTGRGRPWPVMWINCSVTLINVALDYVMVFGRFGCPEMGIRGAGLATVISAFCGFLMYAGMTMTRENDRLYRILTGWRPEKELFGRLVLFGLPVGVQFFLDIVSITIFDLLVGRLGTVELAATNIALNINTVAFFPMIGTGFAITMLVGKYLGQNRPDLAERSTYAGFRVCLFYMTLVAAAYVLLPQVFITPFTFMAEGGSYDEVSMLAVVLLRYVAAYSVFDSLNMAFSSAVKGAGDTRFVLWITVLTSIFLLAVPSYVAISVLGLGLEASWLILTAYFSILGVIFLLRFLGGKWKVMRVIEEEPA